MISRLWFASRRWLAVRLASLPGMRFRRRRVGHDFSTADIGLIGENVAARWLRWHGRKVLYRNFRAPEGGEVDISCRHKDTLAFNEVKTRTSEGAWRPADAVTRDKQALIIRGAKEWLRLLGNPVIPFRFDIVEVLLIEGQRAKVNVIERAFQMDEQSLLGRI